MNRNQFKINKAISAIKHSKSIIILTGAGISTDSGIQDFRGEEGFYKTASSQYNLPYPEAIFEIAYFKKNPKAFYQYSAHLLNNNYSPSPFHLLLSDLESKGKKITIITQNIDGLHQKAGSKRVIACHGDYSSASCSSCEKKYNINDFIKAVKRDEILLCNCGAPVKPDIVFFGENLTEDFYRFYLNPPDTELFITAGSSLTVHPAAGLASQLAAKNPSIRINLNPTPYDSCFNECLNISTQQFTQAFYSDKDDNNSPPVAIL